MTSVPLGLRRRLSLLRRTAALPTHALSIAVARAAAGWREADVAIFHEFAPPPIGGGHQFLRALWREIERRGLRVENNTISRRTRACLFNSFNFDFARLRWLRRAGCRLVHRVDGPIDVYRGRDDGVDGHIWRINQLADATIFQSQYSLAKHRELGMEFRAPTVVLNAVDPSMFHPHGRAAFDSRRKLRLISTSWSDNPNKGSAVYRWLEDHLDWERFEYTFVGRAAERFTRIRALPPTPSDQLAQLLRQHDIFITASRNDPCSNALIEALSCGLPAIYLRSGGHPEIVGNAGFGFEAPEEIPALLDRLAAEYTARQAQIALPTLPEVADRYLAVMGLSG
jgi:glycosyltransferase involved in cell wall biosynthesis